MASTIKLKNGTGIPLVGDLVQGEPALDLTNKRLYTEDAGGVVIEVGTNPSTLNVVGAATFGGNLLVGTNSALAKITIGGSGANRVAMVGGTGDLFVGYDGASDALQVASNTSIVFQTGAGYGEAARIDASGNLLVGTTAASGRVAVANQDGGVGVFSGQATGSTPFKANMINADTKVLDIHWYGATLGWIKVNTGGTAVEYVTSSDPRLKSEFVEPVGALAKIIEARENGAIGVFNFLADPETPVLGYNAHKLIDLQSGFGGAEGVGPRDLAIGEEYEPAVLGEDGNVITPAKKVSPAGVDQSKRVPLLEAAIYELLQMNQAQQDAITSLTARLDAAGL